MNNDCWCSSCEKFVEADSIATYREKDVGWSEARCPYCHNNELEEIDLGWVVTQVKEVAKDIQRTHLRGARHQSERLEYAADFLEAI